MSKKSELLKFNENYEKLIKSLDDENLFQKKFNDAFLAGNRTLYQKYIKETKNFDEEWVKTIESYVPSLSKIIGNPRESLKLVEEVVQIEKAKKVDSNSIKHLSSNTHFIKEVNRDGMVIPKKILTSYSDIDYHTYENRFIMTLIDRLFIFVRNRYNTVKNNIESFEKRHLYVESNFNVNNTEAKVCVDVLLTDKVYDDEINKYNTDLLKRIEYLNRVVSSFKSGEFMNMMSGAHKVNPPIMKTNVITKNVDYRNAYMLWLFLDRYNTLAFTAEIEEKDLNFTEKYEENLYREILHIYTTMISNQEMNKLEYEEITPTKEKHQSSYVITKHPNQIELTFEDEILEDNAINEYYLNEYQEIFKKSLEYYEEHSKTYETSLKRAIRDTINITNALYESYFKLEEEKDVFKKLVTEVDIDKELADARHKAMIAKIVRETKEVDYNNALRLERRQIRDIERFNKLVLKRQEERIKQGKLNIDEAKKLEEEQRLVKAKDDVLKSKLEDTKRFKEEINEFQKTVNDALNEYIKELEKRELNELRDYERKESRRVSDIINNYLKDNIITTAMTDKRIVHEKNLLKELNELTKTRLETNMLDRIKDLKKDLERRNQVILRRKENEMRESFDLSKFIKEEILNTESSLKKELEKFKASLVTRSESLGLETRTNLDLELKNKLNELKNSYKEEIKETIKKLEEEYNKL